jgi:hypothetical protein
MSLAGRTARSFLVRRFRRAAFEFPHLLFLGRIAQMIGMETLPTTMAWTIQQRHFSRAALPLIVPSRAW